jgi:diguanylate cyclase (GGDEF)-like protein
LERSSRAGLELTALLIDADHFKRVNDEFGHAVGDQVLIELARTLGRNLRPSDLLARFGGEEFVLVLPGLGAEAGLRRAEELRMHCAGIELRGDPVPVKVTVSIGVAVYPTHGRTPAELTQAADAALYQAKAAGRNQVVMAGAPTAAAAEPAPAAPE